MEVNKSDSMLKVSLFVDNLCENSIVRAIQLAKIFEYIGYEVEFLGLLVGPTGVYLPYRDSYNYKTVRVGKSILSVLCGAIKLSNMASGTICYACKPLVSSFLPALLYARWGKKYPIYLDIEDDDVHSQKPSGFILYLKSIVFIMANHYGYYQNKWLDRYIRKCKKVTVVSKRLVEIYPGSIMFKAHSIDGGEYIEIGTKEHLKLKEKYGIPENKINILFAGRARNHKGLLEIANAIKERHSASYSLILAGSKEQKIFLQCKEILGDNCRLIGFIENKFMAELTKACDISVVLQDHSQYAIAQVPAKLLEAITCGRPVISTDVGDIREILLGDSGNAKPRGWILSCSDKKRVVEILDEILISKKKISEYGLNAMNYSKENLSIEQKAHELRAILGHEFN